MYANALYKNHLYVRFNSSDLVRCSKRLSERFISKIFEVEKSKSQVHTSITNRKEQIASVYEHDMFKNVNMSHNDRPRCLTILPKLI